MSSSTSKPQEKPILRMILAGVSSVISQTATHTIETIKVRMQTSGEQGRVSKGNYTGILSTIKSILSQEGPKALYKGIYAAWGRELIYSSLRLGLYEPFKKLYSSSKNQQMPFWKKFLSASSAGLVASVISNPIDFLKIRMQNWEGQSESIFWHIRKVWGEAGIIGFYRGVQITIIRAVINNGAKMSTYDHIKNYFKRVRGYKDGLKLQFSCSMVAGFIMCLFAAPFDLTRSRVFSQDAANPKYRGLVHAMSSTVRNEGVLALYKGFIPMWSRVAPFTVIQLICWEQMRKVCGITSL